MGDAARTAGCVAWRLTPRLRTAPLRFVLVGTPRSATRLTAKALTNPGLTCGHERMFTLVEAHFEFRVVRPCEKELFSSDEIIGESS